ncbi:TRAP transporter small permease subunit [Curvivirga aplysinae]|uniref:TRAP transporter small permease subunit n=1 Tax=Curvivirga aplysinae TaxID=2529852 RepID=UPI0012BCEFAE|nr:TRAP transporter small permease [Curvivirga aplysinae]MTI09911.1 TRAP transporter small permease [Curvivirga aplysinae]
MAGTSMVHEDSSTLSKLDRTLFNIESKLALAGGLVILALMLLAVAQIIGRKLFNLPVPGFIDWVEQAMAVFAFLGVAYCHRLGGHIRMDILVGRLKGRALWVAELVSTLVMLFLTMALTYGSWLHFMRAFTNGDSSIDIALPLWPAKFMVPLALSILSLRLVIHTWGYIRAVISGEDEPIAVPLIEDAATQAAHEAESVSGASVDEKEEKA